jgi:hypothetical protein
MIDGEQDVFIAPWWLARALVLVWVGLLVLAISASIVALRFFHNA